METVDRGWWRRFDWALLGLVAGLLVMGLGNLLSATHAGSTGALSSEVERQLVALAIGSIGLLVVLLPDHRRFQQLALPIYFATPVLVASTLAG